MCKHEISHMSRWNKSHELLLMENESSLNEHNLVGREVHDIEDLIWRNWKKTSQIKKYKMIQLNQERRWISVCYITMYKNNGINKYI